jgi:hypothetical protein
MNRGKILGQERAAALVAPAGVKAARDRDDRPRHFINRLAAGVARCLCVGIEPNVATRAPAGYDVGRSVERHFVSELCQRRPQTPVKHHDLRGHSDAHRCCGKSLMGSALVRFGVRQHARPESISKRLLHPPPLACESSGFAA